MWALIRANRRRTALLVVLVLATMAVAGYWVGGTLAGLAHVLSSGHAFAFDHAIALLGVELAVLLWLGLTLLIYIQGDTLLLAAGNASPARREDFPQLYNVVEEMAIAAALPRTPRVYVINDRGMNAFAAGRSPENAAIAVTAGALARLDHNQLQGLVAHETAHIANGDVLFMTMATLMTGAIAGGTPDMRVNLRSNDPRFTGGARRVPLLHRLLRAFAGTLALFVPVYAAVILFGIPRRRDFLADACAAVYTRYPEGLAAALYTMAGDACAVLPRNRQVATLYTLNPYRKEYGMHTPLILGLTHAPVHRRIEILRAIHGTVSLARYEEAWRRTGGRARLFPAGVTRQCPEYPCREEAALPSAKPRAAERAGGDIVRSLNGYVFLPCSCGMRVKLPPEFAMEHAQCPRCGKVVSMPAAQAAPVAVPVSGEEDCALEIAWPGGVWMTFKCACGARVQLSPECRALHVGCPECGRRIRILRKGEVH